MRNVKIIVLFFFCVSFSFAQAPIKLSVKLGGQTQHSSFRAEHAVAWSTEGKLSYALHPNFDISLNVGYDRTMLQEDSVILEWDWAYWDERYIDWLLTGASKEEVDSISTVLEYWRPDSSYHGVFTPKQWMDEVRLGFSMDYIYPMNNNLQLYGSIGGGMSLYTRRLMVVENWMKVFTWNWDSIAVAQGTLSDDELENYNIYMGLHNEDPSTYQLDTLNAVYQLKYDYYARISHFAPDKHGIKLFLSPSIGLRYAIREDIDLDLSYQGIFYLNVNDIGGKETFPLKSKSAIYIGLSFRY